MYIICLIILAAFCIAFGVQKIAKIIAYGAIAAAIAWVMAVVGLLVYDSFKPKWTPPVGDVIVK